MTQHPEMKRQTCISAPGKVLVAGGYLVLDQAYSGLVIGTDSRFYTTVRSSEGGSNDEAIRINVRSPQFNDGKWNYIVKELDPCVLESEAGSERNKYLEYAIALTLSVIAASSKDFKARLGNHLDILIVGHNDFYSQRPQLESLNLPLSTKSLASLPPFCPTLTTIANVHKTGLGSSAAMISSLVSALLAHFNVISLNSDTPNNDMQFAHNMSQFVHCLAQGKVGSGFDVSSAVYGSHLYKRFNPAVLEGLMTACEERGISNVSGKDILEVVAGGSDKWDSVVGAFRLQRGLRLMLADVDCGSSTPKLVSGVLGWRKENPEEALRLWTDLDKANMQVAEGLIRVRDRYEELQGSQRGEYDGATWICSTSHASTWKNHENVFVQMFGHVYESFLTVRKLLREMSSLAGVPVEPESQTRLLDSISSLNGVVMSGVPGAGGFDAIFTLVIEVPGTNKNQNAVEKVWNEWTESKVGPLLAGASENGMRLESVADVNGLSRFFN